ncbi:carbonic anhydrase [Derxia gummosa]|uniref:Carbonic anhydrase n=1 Tax=Derxia gummosa DSM 723 TaxID=1121388 RepID=A0A8B6X900_9BURK|nr:carbonic anhydrase [Derxia gummosa]
MNTSQHVLRDLGMSRRGFTKLAAFGAGAALFGRSSLVLAGGHADALLLSCMDYRLMDNVASYMNGRGLTKHYDHVVLAGASLGAVSDKFPAWNQTFWGHLDVAIKLHAVPKVIVMDHRDCGAYKLVMGEGHLASVETERDAHAKVIGDFKQQVAAKYPSLQVEGLLMALDGSVEAV